MNTLARTLFIFGLLIGLAAGLAAQMPVGYGYPKINDAVVWGEAGEWIHIPALHGRNPTLVSTDGLKKVLPAPPGGILNFMSLRNQSVWMVAGNDGDKYIQGTPRDYLTSSMMAPDCKFSRLEGALPGTPR